MKLSDLIDEACVFADLERGSRRRALERMARGLAAAGAIDDAEALLTALLERERMASTALGGGIAIPHAIAPFIRRPVLAVGLAPGGLDFETPDGLPVRVLFLLALPIANQSCHLALLSRLARILSTAGLCERLAQSDPACLCRILREHEALHEQRFN